MHQSEEGTTGITTYYETANNGKSTIESMLANWSALDSKVVDDAWERKQSAEFHNPTWKVAFGNYRIRKRREAGAAHLFAQLAPTRSPTDLIQARGLTPRRPTGFAISQPAGIRQPVARAPAPAVEVNSNVQAGPTSGPQEGADEEMPQSRSFIILDGAGLEQGEGSSSVPIEID